MAISRALRAALLGSLAVLSGEVCANFANDAQGAPATAETGQSIRMAAAAGTIVQPSVRSGALVAAASGGATTAAYASIDCKEDVKAPFADIIFGDTIDAFGLLVCGGPPSSTLGPSGTEILQSSIHITYTATDWTVQYGSGGSLTTVASGTYPARLHRKVRVGWRLNGNDVYVLLPNGTEVGPITSAALASRTNHYLVFEIFRNTTGTPTLKIVGVSANLFADPATAGRTNLLTSPGSFGDAAWTKTNAGVTAGQADPLGGTAADQLLETAVSGNHSLYQAVAKATSALPYELRVDVLPINGRLSHLAVFNAGFSSGLDVYFDPNTSAIGTPNGAFTSPSWSIYPLGVSSGGLQWHRCRIAFTTDTSATNQVFYEIASADTVNSYLGDITKGERLFNPGLIQRV
jgi:hypothetical protein